MWCRLLVLNLPSITHLKMLATYCTSLISFCMHSWMHFVGNNPFGFSWCNSTALYIGFRFLRLCFEFQVGNSSDLWWAPEWGICRNYCFSLFWEGTLTLTTMSYCFYFLILMHIWLPWDLYIYIESLRGFPMWATYHQYKSLNDN